MPAPKGNQFAKKAESEVMDTTTLIRSTAGEREKWDSAAKKAGKKLAAWIRDRLNRAARR